MFFCNAQKILAYPCRLVAVQNVQRSENESKEYIYIEPLS